MKNVDTKINDLFDNHLDTELKELRQLFNQAIKDGLDDDAAVVYQSMRDVVAKKNVVVSELVEDYFSQRGEMPEYNLLDRLSTWILRYMEDVEDDMTVLTERQMRTRNREKEMSFYSPESREFHIETDGNRLVKKAPGMDSDETHKVRVKLPSDNADLRQFNGPLKKYFTEFI